MRVVFDTSVLVAAARSRDGASFALIRSVPSPHFEITLAISAAANNSASGLLHRVNFWQ